MLAGVQSGIALQHPFALLLGCLSVPRGLESQALSSLTVKVPDGIEVWSVRFTCGTSGRQVCAGRSTAAASVPRRLAWGAWVGLSVVASQGPVTS